MSKYKFDLTPQIKGFVEWQLEHYKEDRREVEEYKRDMIPSATPGYSLSPGGGNAERTTENVAVRIETNAYVVQTERSCKAIECVLSQLSSTDIKLIDLVYWRHTHTIIGAATAVNLSQQSAYQHINKILGMVAAEMGLINLA